MVPSSEQVVASWSFAELCTAQPQLVLTKTVLQPRFCSQQLGVAQLASRSVALLAKHVQLFDKKYWQLRNDRIATDCNATAFTKTGLTPLMIITLFLTRVKCANLLSECSKVLSQQIWGGWSYSKCWYDEGVGDLKNTWNKHQVIKQLTFYLSITSAN